MLGVVIVVAIAIALLIFLVHWCSPHLERYVEKHQGSLRTTTLEKVLAEAKTGDAILMAGHSPGERVMKSCTRSIFSHIGLLLREDDVVYVWDADMGQGIRDGPRLMKLSDKLARYKGFKHAAYIPLTCSERPTEAKMLEVISRYENLDMDPNVWAWWAAHSPTSALFNRLKNPSKVFCSELAAMTLQDLGVMRHEHIPAWYSPGDWFERVSRLNSHLNTGYRYGKAEFFTFGHPKGCPSANKVS